MPFQTKLRPFLPLQTCWTRWRHRQEVRAAERELRRLEAEYEALRAQWPAPDPQTTLALTTCLTQNDQAWLRVMTRLQLLQLPIT